MVRLGRGPRKEPPETDEPDPDRALVERALVVPAAFEAIVLRYRTPLLRFFFAKLGDWHDAEDLTQETLLDAYARLATFAPRPHATFRSWLFRIAHHARVDAVRKRSVRGRVDVPFPEAPGWADPEPTPEAAALRADASSELRRLLEGLTADQRAVLQLRAADLTNREIADALHMKEATVRKHQERAFDRMRAMLAREAETGISAAIGEGA